MGVLAATAIRHAYAHYRPHVEPEKLPTHPGPTGHLPPAVREQMLAEAQTNFQNVLTNASNELQKDLGDTAVEIKKQLEKMGTETIGQELEKYKVRLEELQKQTEDMIGGAHQELSEHQNELKTKMAEQVEAEKKQLLDQIDTKLADAVQSFLLETLQHNVDLGAQSTYLTAMLEEHKHDIAKGVKDED